MLLLPAATPFPCPSPTTVILLSFAAALLTFAILLSMVGCCVYARFVILCLSHYPLHTFILISRHHVSVDAIVAGCHPFLPPIASHVLLLLLPATARLHRSPVDGWLLRCVLCLPSSSAHFCHRPLVRSLTLLSPTQN